MASIIFAFCSHKNSSTTPTFLNKPWFFAAKFYLCCFQVNLAILAKNEIGKNGII
jgi:hypothetical protein